MLPLYSVNKFFRKLCYFNKISPYQRVVMESLLSFFGKNQTANPSIPLIAQVSGVSETTVKKTLREFRLRGWIDWKNTRKGKRQSSNVYCLTLTSEMVNSVLNAIRDLKANSKRIRQLFSRYKIHHSPYYEIKKMAQRKYRQIMPSQRSSDSFLGFFQRNDALEPGSLFHTIQKDYVW